MKTPHSRLALVSLVVLPALGLGLAGCGGGGGGGNGGGGGGPPPVAPANLTYSASERLEISQVAIEPITATVDGDAPQFSVVPALPAGLVLDPANGTISGAALQASARRDYDLKASNGGGASHFTLTLQVVPAPRFVYATSTADHSISTFAQDVSSGEITRASQSLTSASDAAPERLVFHQNGRFAYAPDMTTSSVRAFTIDPDSGRLDAQGSVPVATGPHAIAIDPTGQFAYVTNQGSDLLHQFRIDQVSGALTQIGGAIATSIQPTDIKIDPTGHLVFITLRGRDTDGLGSAVQGFTLDPVSGQLTATWPSQFLLGGRPISLAIDPIKPVMYLTLEWFQDALPVRFDPVTGEMHPVALRHAGIMPLSIGVHVSGKFAYLVSQGENTVVAYSIDPGTSGLTALGTYSTGVAPTSLTMDPSGRFLYVAAKDSAEVITYTINPATGGLTELDRLRTRGAPCNIVLGTGDHPTHMLPRFVHVAGRSSGDVTSYAVDAGTGALSQTAVMVTGQRPASIAIDPRQRFAWIANEDSSTIAIRSVSSVTGALSGSVPDQAVLGKPTHVAVDPTARFLFSVAHDVVLAGDGWLTAWSIDQLSGALTQIGTQEVGANPTSVTVEPTGRFVYAANHGSGVPGTSGISAFAIDQETGAIAAVGTPVAAPGIVDLVFHPRGYAACAVLSDSNALAHYALDIATGQLTGLPPVTASGPEPVGVAFAPLGQFAYVASRGFAGAGNIAFHPVTNGGLGAVEQTLQDGTHPAAIAVDPTGRFVYATNAGSDTVSIARIDAATGQMTLSIPIATGVEPGAIAVTGITQ